MSGREEGGRRPVRLALSCLAGRGRGAVASGVASVRPSVRSSVAALCNTSNADVAAATPPPPTTTTALLLSQTPTGLTSLLR